MSGNVNYRHKRTSTANKRPLPASIQTGELVLNIESGQPGAFIKTNTNTVVKLGPIVISPTIPTMEGSGTTTYLTGEMWLDTTADILKIYDGSAWVPCFSGVSITTDPDPPATPSVGDLWYDDDASDLYIYVGQDTNAWVNIGPGASGGVASVAADEPAGPVNGQLWFDTDTGFLYVYNAGTVSWEIATGGGAAAILDVAFGGAWDGDSVNGPSRNTVYDIFNGLSTEINPDWDLGATANIDVISGGVLDIESGGLLNVSDSGEINININGEFRAVDGATVELDTQVDLQANSTLLAASGATIDLDAADSVTVPTNAKVNGGSFTNEAASQAWVYQYLPIDTMNARLSVDSTEPHIRPTTIDSSNLFYVPFKGQNLWLYNTVDLRWEPYTLTTQITKALVGLSPSLPYDVFVYDNGGTLDLELVVWATSNSRTTSLGKQNGVLVKAGQANKRYVGVVCTTAAGTIKQSVGYDLTTNTNMTTGFFNYYNTLNVTSNGVNSSPQSITAPATLLILNTGYWQGMAGNADGVSVSPQINLSILGSTTTATTLDARLRVYYRSTGTLTTQKVVYTNTHVASAHGASLGSNVERFGDVYVYPTVHVGAGSYNNIQARYDCSWQC